MSVTSSSVRTTEPFFWVSSHWNCIFVQHNAKAISLKIIFYFGKKPSTIQFLKIYKQGYNDYDKICVNIRFGVLCGWVYSPFSRNGSITVYANIQLYRLSHLPCFGQTCTKHIFLGNICSRNYVDKWLLFGSKYSQKKF